MIIYPSGDTKTDFHMTPWASLLIALVSLVGYFTVHYPMKVAAEEQLEFRHETFLKALQDQVDQEGLKQAFWAGAQDNPHVVVDPENQGIFNQAVVSAYHQREAVPQPMVELAASQRNLLTAIVPHDLRIMIVGLICLLCCGLLMENLYDRLIVIGFFTAAAVGWILAAPLIQSPFMPKTIFAWSNAVAVFLLVTLILSPRTSVILSLVGWFGKPFEVKYEVPVVLFAVVFLGANYGVNHWLGEYNDYYSPSTLVAQITGAGLFALVLLVLPKRGQRNETAVEMVNRRLADAEVMFNEEKEREGFALLKELLETEPTTEQTRRIADLAWTHHNNDIAERGYRIVLRDIYQAEDLSQVLAVVEEMLFRNLPVPGTFVRTSLQVSLRRGDFGTVRKLLPYFQDHADLDAKTVTSFYSDLVDKILAQEEPNRGFLNELRGWLKTHHPECDAYQKASLYFKQSEESGHGKTPFSQTPRINKHIDIELVTINPNSVRLRVGDGPEREVPWTAVIGFFGVKREKDGPLGTMLIKFKRQLFGCDFDESKIRIRDEHNFQPAFETVWENLKVKGPTDVPFLDFQEFEMITDMDRYAERVQDYLNANY